MKDSEFIELLNLYLDHEITATDAARLESEVQSNPARRRVYQDYCRMQKACKMLTEDFASEPESTSRNVIPFDRATPGRSTSGRGWFVGGAIAAMAAAVAVVFVTRPGHQSNSVNATPVAQTEPVVAPTVVAANEPAATPAAHGIERRSANPLSLRANAQNEALALATSAVQTDPNFAWLQEVRLAPVQAPSADQLRFQATPSLRPENRTFKNGTKPLPQDVESIAIRFQR